MHPLCPLVSHSFFLCLPGCWRVAHVFFYANLDVIYMHRSWIERFLYSFCFPRAVLCDGVHFALSCFSGCLPGYWRGVHVVFHVNLDVIYIRCAWIERFLLSFCFHRAFFVMVCRVMIVLFFWVSSWLLAMCACRFSCKS